MDSKPLFLDLKSGLRIAYKEYGDTTGEPVILCHGWPSSRLMGAAFHDAGCELGLRVISPDRPGLGLSQFQPGRTILDWPPLLGEFTNALGIRRYRVLGISGGAPYAYIAAWARPDEVRAVSVACGVPPLAELGTMEGMRAVYIWMLRIHRGSPAAIRLLLRMVRPFVRIPLFKALKIAVLPFLGSADRAAMSQDTGFEICFESNRAAWEKSADGVALDGELYSRPWGFPVGEIRVPVRIWHGKKDTSFSWKLSEEMARKIAGSISTFPAEDGHYSLPLAHARGILEDLKNAG